MLESEFKALASQGYNRIPMVAECLADLDTPLSIYRTASCLSLWSEASASDATPSSDSRRSAGLR